MDNVDWFTIVQTAGIISSFLFTAYQLWSSRRSQIAANEIKLIELHRDLWKLTIENPELLGPFMRKPEPEQLSVSTSQSRFLNFLFLHISGAYRLQKAGETTRTGDFPADLKSLLSFPAIRKFWEENKRLYDRDFVSFVDSCAPD